MKNDRVKKRLDREIELMKKLSTVEHENIVKYYESEFCDACNSRGWELAEVCIACSKHNYRPVLALYWKWVRR